MSKKDMCNQTVTLFNLITEGPRGNVYNKTYLHNVYCPNSIGVGYNNQGRRATNEAVLYIFDTLVTADDGDGNSKTYLPYDEWMLSSSKGDYWTITDRGEDCFVLGTFVGETPTVTDSKFKIVSHSTKQTGSKGMWHIEVRAK